MRFLNYRLIYDQSHKYHLFVADNIQHSHSDLESLSHDVLPLARYGIIRYKAAFTKTYNA